MDVQQVADRWDEQGQHEEKSYQHGQHDLVLCDKAVARGVLEETILVVWEFPIEELEQGCAALAESCDD